MNVYRVPPDPLPSLRDVEALEAALPRRYAAPVSFAMYMHLADTEPFEHAEPREERRARERAAAVPCPVFVTEWPAHWVRLSPPVPKGPSVRPVNVQE